MKNIKIYFYLNVIAFGQLSGQIPSLHMGDYPLGGIGQTSGNLDPNNPANQTTDSDGDGLSNANEIETYKTDPLTKDSDGDGFSDGDEIELKTDPLDPDSCPVEILLEGRYMFSRKKPTNTDPTNFQTIGSTDYYFANLQTQSENIFYEPKLARSAYNNIYTFPASPNPLFINNFGVTVATAAASSFMNQVITKFENQETKREQVVNLLDSRLWIETKKITDKTITKTFLKKSTFVKDYVEAPFPESIVSMEIAAGSRLSKPYDLISNLGTNALNDTLGFVQVFDTLTPVTMRIDIDANHDGYIHADITSKENPFVFWLNNDKDVVHVTDLLPTGLANTLLQDDVNDPGIPVNSSDLMIDTQYDLPLTRDLEDFYPLDINVSGNLLAGLKAGYFNLFLSWEEAELSPEINIFMRQNEDVDLYIKSPESSSKQIIEKAYPIINGKTVEVAYGRGLGTVGSKGFSIPLFVWFRSEELGGKLPLLFEGKAKGKGKLMVSIVNNGVCSPGNGVWIELKDISQLYQRWTCGDIESEGLPPDAERVEVSTDPKPVSGSSFPADTSLGRRFEDDNFILLVHGWNMETWEKDRFAETAFKRLWHLGYKGRFGFFRWPTFFGMDIKDPDNLVNNFDYSEFASWRSSDALLKLLMGLNIKYKGNVHLIAHSHGNVACCEALKKAKLQVVKNYIACQAAVSADLFKRQPSITNQWKDVFGEVFTGDAETISQAGALLSGFQEIRTPNIYAYFPILNGHEYPYNSEIKYPQNGPRYELGKYGSLQPGAIFQYEPYFTAVKGCGNWINYYNPKDWALGSWIVNQSFKPHGRNRVGLLAIKKLTKSGESTRLRLNYSYENISKPSNPARWEFMEKSFAGTNAQVLSIGESEPNGMLNKYKIFSFVAQSVSKPLGRQSNTGGVFGNINNFGASRESEWSTFGNAHPGHSLQFRSSLADSNILSFWARIIDDIE